MRERNGCENSSAIRNSVSMGASLKAGAYIVQVDGVNGTKTFKVVKTK